MTLTPPVKVTPLLSETTRLNAQLIKIDGWRIPQLYSSIEEETTAASQRVALVDASASYKIMVEGTGATSFLEDKLEIRQSPIGQAISLGPGYVYTLKKDQLFIHLPLETGGELAHGTLELAGEAGDGITVTDFTHGWAELFLVGSRCAELLSRICALNFNPNYFAIQTAKQSSVARTRQLIIHREVQTGLGSQLPAYSLIGARSLAIYLWQVILEAGKDLAIRPMGRAALEQLVSGHRPGA